MLRTEHTGPPKCRRHRINRHRGCVDSPVIAILAAVRNHGIARQPTVTVAIEVHKDVFGISAYTAQTFGGSEKASLPCPMQFSLYWISTCMRTGSGARLDQIVAFAKTHSHNARMQQATRSHAS